MLGYQVEAIFKKHSHSYATKKLGKINNQLYARRYRRDRKELTLCF